MKIYFSNILIGFIFILFSCKKEERKMLFSNFSFPKDEKFIDQLIKFEGISSDDIIKHEWNFGDGETSTIPNPNHIYSKSGNYNISYSAYDINGDKLTINDSIKIYQIEIDTIYVKNVTSYPNHSALHFSFKLYPTNFVYSSNNMIYDENLNMIKYYYSKPYILTNDVFYWKYKEYWDFCMDYTLYFSSTSYFNPYNPTLLNHMQYSYIEPDNGFETIITFKKTIEN